MIDPSNKPPVMQSLSARLLVLTMAFVMVSELFIYVPSIARFRLSWLEQRIEAANLSLVALRENPSSSMTQELRKSLLGHVGAQTLALRLGDTRYLVLTDDTPSTIDTTIDLAKTSTIFSIIDAIALLLDDSPGTMRVIGTPRVDPKTTIEIVLPIDPLRAALTDYSWRIFTLSLIISILTAMLVFTALRWMIVRPIQRITHNMIGFRRAPEDRNQMLTPSSRKDEIGIAERELTEMQRQIRAALKQRARLAALGLAVSKVNHDLRNILATAQLVSDHLTTSDDPEVRRLTPRLIESLDRAIALCSSTLQYGRADEASANLMKFPLRPLFDEVGTTVLAPTDGKVAWHVNAPEDLVVRADREQIFRVLLNIGGNAAQALMRSGHSGQIEISAHRAPGRIEIDLRDNGPGLPANAREHLFEPFAGTSHSGGTGLGLPIARELMRAHGGDIHLVATGPSGTHFRLILPDHSQQAKSSP